MYTLFHGEVQDGKHVDQVLREYFSDYSYQGVFFDVGAFEPIRISNSYHFEKNGWTCYCFEANPEGIPLLKEHRANVFNYAISDTDQDTITFHVVTSSTWTAGYSAIEISEDYKKIFGDVDPKNIKEVTVAQKSLNSIIKEEIPSLGRIDIMSIDVEGGEYKCLKGIDLAVYKPRVVVVENVTPQNKEIQNELERCGYRLDKHISYNQYYLADDFFPSK